MPLTPARSRLAALLVVTTACAGTTGSDTTATDPDPSPYVVDAPPADEPTASLDEIGTALQDALDLTMSITALPVEASYDAAMAERTYECPYQYDTPDGTYWYDSCQVDSGAKFDGYVFALGEDGAVDPYTGLSLDYWYAYGGATVTTSDGHDLELAGGATRYEAYGDYGGVQVESYYNQVTGTFLWDGPEAKGTWLELGLDPDLTWQATSYPGYDAAAILLQGGFSGFDGGWAIAYDDNLLADAALGLPCPQEPNGTIGVRATDGTWYDVRFDGTDQPDDPDYDPAACDGCGTAYFQAQELGRVCADFSGVLARAVQPW